MCFIVLLNFAWRPNVNATIHPASRFGSASGSSNPPSTPGPRHCHALQLTWLASCWAVYHLKKNSRVESGLAFLTRLSPCSPAPTVSISLSFCLSNCHPSSLRPSRHCQLLPNSSVDCKQLVSLVSIFFLLLFLLRFYLNILCLISVGKFRK